MRSATLGTILAGLVLAGHVGQAAGGRPALSADDVVRIALENSPRLRAARFSAAAALTNADREKPVSNPTLTAQAEGTLQGPRVTFPRGAADDATVLPPSYARVTLTLEQPVYRPGLAAARTRYLAQTRATVWETQRAVNDAILAVRRAFHELLTAQAMVAVAREGVALASKHRDLAASMRDAGLSSERDVKAADADLAEAEQGMLRAENGEASAMGNLNRLMGRDPGAPIEVARSAGPPPIPDAAQIGTTMALARRPEIRLLETNLAAARAGLSLAGAQGAPALSARAIATRQTPSAFARTDYFAAGIVLTWNLLDGGVRRADRAEAAARAEELRALVDEARLGVRLEVRQAEADLRAARGRVHVSERQMTSARGALEVSELRYQARAASLLEVSSARLGVVRADGARAQALGDLQIAYAELLHATGADVPREPPIQHPAADRAEHVGP
jgi:outer membrane protein